LCVLLAEGRKGGAGVTYALFLFTPCEAAGGIDDLECVGTLEECIAKAEASRSYAQIVELPSLRVVRRGDTVSHALSDDTGLTKDRGTRVHSYRWEV
jgi:hypothetical protein